MNIIRSKAVELSVIPAIAYKQKLQSGGAGIRILRLDTGADAAATIDKRTGEAVSYGGADEVMFPYEAFEEALELTLGMPYSARGKIVIKADHTADPDETQVCSADEGGDLSILEGNEYTSIVERYSDEKGKMNYQLLNKDFIQFAAKSKVVSAMIGERAKTDDIVMFIVKNRAAHIAGEKEHLSDATAEELIDALNEIDPRSAFKELKAHINRQLARNKSHS
jgi:hypothetical protein